MKKVLSVLGSLFLAQAALADPAPLPSPAPAPAAAPAASANAAAILARMLESDPWGLSGAAVDARAKLTDKNGAQSELAFSARSQRLVAPLAQSIVRFSAPPELAGAGFLQVQKADGDDDRFLFLPDLKRSRRISGNLRANAFMGTDMSFADLDRRDLREATAALLRSEAVERWDCFVLDVVPKGDSEYSHVELWIRKDNYLPLRMRLYDRARTLLKTFQALEVKRVSGQWFISRSRMVNEQQSHTTDLVLERISTSDTFAVEDFTVRALEKTQ